MESKESVVMKLLMNSCRIHRKMCEEAASKLNIHRSQHLLLMHISKNGGAVSQTNLAVMLGISTAAVNVTVKKLLNEGYVEKSIDEDDGRYKSIKISEKGKEVVKQTKKIFSSIDKKMFEKLSEEELELLAGCLQKINSGAGEKGV